MSAVGPLLRVFVGEVYAALRHAFIYLCALGLIGLVALDFASRHARSAAAMPAPQPEWIDVGRPFPAFSLILPELDGEPRYAIQRHASGAGRKDILTFGALEAAGKPAAAIEIYRPGGELSEIDDAAVGAGELRLSVRAPKPDTIASKFGDVIVDAFVDRSGDAPRQCLRFSREFEDPRLIIGGWYCNASLEVVDRAFIACALDRLTLLAAGSDPKIGALFARAELKRTFCGQRSVFVAATPKRTDWIETARDPRLRGRE